jgi:hypothetical protein
LAELPGKAAAGTAAHEELFAAQADFLAVRRVHDERRREARLPLRTDRPGVAQALPCSNRCRLDIRSLNLW